MRLHFVPIFCLLVVTSAVQPPAQDLSPRAYVDVSRTVLYSLSLSLVSKPDAKGLWSGSLGVKRSNLKFCFGR